MSGCTQIIFFPLLLTKQLMFFKVLLLGFSVFFSSVNRITYMNSSNISLSVYNLVLVPPTHHSFIHCQLLIQIWVWGLESLPSPLECQLTVTG